MTKTLQLEEGKRYVRRDGVVTEPIASYNNKLYPWTCNGITYTDDGHQYFSDKTSRVFDLIEEYTIDPGDGYRIYDQKAEGLECPENLEILIDGKNWQRRPVSHMQLCMASIYRVPIVLDIDPGWRILDKTEPLMDGDQVYGSQVYVWTHLSKWDIDNNNKIKGCCYRRRIKPDRRETLKEKPVEEERAEIQEPVNSSVDPGEGYRLLSDKEIVQPDDEREYLPIINCWRTADIANGQLFVGSTVSDIRNTYKEWNDIVFRRQIKPKEKSMNVAKFIGSWALRGLNYWVTEPAMNIVKRIMWSVRYVTLTAMIAGCVYGYNYPESVKSFLSSCLPKITIEAPEIMR